MILSTRSYRFSFFIFLNRFISRVVNAGFDHHLVVTLA